MKQLLTDDEIRKADGMLHSAVEQLVHTFHVFGAKDAELTARLVRRRWNQLRGSDCALRRGVHLSNYHASLCIDALEYMEQYGGQQERELVHGLRLQLEGMVPR